MVSLKGFSSRKLPRDCGIRPQRGIRRASCWPFANCRQNSAANWVHKYLYRQKKRAAKRPTYSLFMSKFRPFSKIIAFDISFCVVSATQCSLLSSVYCRTNSAAYRALRSRSNVREFARSWLLTGCVENLNLRCSEKLKNFL